MKRFLFALLSVIVGMPAMAQTLPSSFPTVFKDKQGNVYFRVPPNSKEPVRVLIRDLWVEQPKVAVDACGMAKITVNPVTVHQVRITHNSTRPDGIPTSYRIQNLDRAATKLSPLPTCVNGQLQPNVFMSGFYEPNKMYVPVGSLPIDRNTQMKLEFMTDQERAVVPNQCGFALIKSSSQGLSVETKFNEQSFLGLPIRDALLCKRGVLYQAIR